MKPARWVCCKRWWAGLAAALLLPLAAAQALAPVAVEVQLSDAAQPAGLSADWEPAVRREDWARNHPGLAGGTAWYRVRFELPPHRAGSGSWALYMPYLYDGARLWLNGEPLAAIAQTNAELHVRWERPHLVTMPESLLRAGRNELLLRAVLTDPGGLQLRRLEIGPIEDLLPVYDRRLFVVRTMPQATVATCLVVGLFVLFVWWRRRAEVLYGLFGLAAVLWSVRTLTFVIEVMPAEWWPWWRVVYHSATGGFIVVLALFAMRFAGVHAPRLARALALYWAIGPIAMLASGGRLDSQVGLIWTGGLIPIGLSIIGFTALAWWRQRSASSLALMLAVAAAVLAGIHDYVVAWNGAAYMPTLLRDWMGHRIFLLHHAANALLLVMVSILTLRFVQALDNAEDLNRELDSRVAAREIELAKGQAALLRLERERAGADERQRIMQDLHDGLGSQLFVALSRVEQGRAAPGQLAQWLRECIADMRLTFEVVAPEPEPLASVLSNFRFRWATLLQEAGLRSHWHVDLPPGLPEPSPSVVLQMLRIVQEALTNVLKHAAANEVQVGASVDDGRIVLSIRDDGRGLPPGETPAGARGLGGMRQRATRMGGALTIESTQGATCVTLRIPL
ncbi:MAG: ATP-binding protein [Rubrivivax sp.]